MTRATPVVLAGLLKQIPLPAGGGSTTQPLAGRATAVLACPFDDTESLALADDMFRQQQLPTEVIVPDSRADFAGIRRLKDRGVTVRTVATRPDDRWSPAEWAQLAAAATTPWTALWEQPSGNTSSLMHSAPRSALERTPSAPPSARQLSLLLPRPAAG